MSALINLLLTSGQLLGRAALRTLQEAASAGSRARDHLTVEADRLSCVIEEHDSMLGLIQDRAPELSRLLGAETDIRVAVVDGDVRETLDTYLRSIRVPYVQLNNSKGGNLRQDDQIFLTVSPKGTHKEKSKNAYNVSTKKYSTRPYDKDLEFLKQQIREKFKKLLQANVDKANVIDRKVKDIDISKTLRKMTDTQKFILQDLDNLMRCLREVDELRSYLKFVGIKNNTIHVVMMGDDKESHSVSSEPPTPILQALETGDNKIEEKNEEKKPDGQTNGVESSKASSGLGDSYANYLSKVSVERPDLLNNNYNNKLQPIYVHAKRKRDDESTDDDVDGKGRILNVLAQKYLSKRRKRFCDAMLNVGFAGSDKLNWNNDDGSKDTISKAFELKGVTDKAWDECNTGKVLANPSVPGENLQSIEYSLKQVDEMLRIKDKVESKHVSQKSETGIDASRSKLSLRSSASTGSKSNFTREKTQRRWEKRAKKFMKGKEFEKTQKLSLSVQHRSKKVEKNLLRIKRLEDQVRHDCKLMFTNKRQFTRFERQLEYRLFKEKEREQEKDLLLVNQAIFHDVESQIARDMAIGQLEKEVEFASRLISENQLAFNRFQRRMLHRLVNDIEPSQKDSSNLSLLCGKDIIINDKPAFDMIVEKLQSYDLITFDEAPVTSVNTQKILGVADLFVQPEVAPVLEQTHEIPAEDVEFLAEFDGLRISIVKMPGDELVIEGAIEEAHETIENNDVIKIKEPILHVESGKQNSLKLNEIRDEQKMTEQLLNVNEKVFNDCEKMMKSVQIIEPKAKFSTNKEEDSGKLLKQNKGKIGDDKRKISTGKLLYKNAIFRKSKSETSLLADIRKQNLSLYEQIFELNNQKASNLNLDDILGGKQALSLKIDNTVASNTCAENIENKVTVSIQKSEVKSDVDVEKVIEDINQMLAQKEEHPNTKVNKVGIKEKSDRKVVYRKTKLKQSRHNIEKKYEPGSSIKVPMIFCRSEDKHLILDTEKVQEEIVLKQKMRSVLSKHKTTQSRVRKQNLRKVQTKENNSNQRTNAAKIKKPCTPDRIRQNAYAKSEALKRNKFINKNATPVVIDKDLEKKATRKDIDAKKVSEGDSNNPSTKKQIKYKSPEKSKYTKIYEQIKARQAEKMQQLKAKKKPGHDAAATKSKVSGGSKIDSFQVKKEQPQDQAEKSTSAKPPICGSKKETKVVSPLMEVANQTLTALTESECPITNTKIQSEDVHPSTRDSEVSYLSVETLFTSKGIKTMDFVNDASSSELEEVEDHKPRLITSRNCTEEARPTRETKGSAGGGTRIHQSRLVGVASMGDLATGGGGTDLSRKQTRVLVTGGINTDVSKASSVNGETFSERSGASTVWKDSFQSVTDLLEAMERSQAQSVEGKSSLTDLTDLTDVANITDLTDVANITDLTDIANITDLTDVANITDLTADTDGGDCLPNLCLELMDEADIVSLLSNVSSMSSLDSEAKQKVGVVENLREIKSEILDDKFKRKPWGTNVVNEVPSQMKRGQGPPATLPQTSIWSHGPRAKVAAPPKPKVDNRDKKYRYESKDLVMGNKVTRVTYLVEE